MLFSFFFSLLIHIWLSIAENYRFKYEDVEYVVGRFFFPRGRIYPIHDKFITLRNYSINNEINHDSLCAYFEECGCKLERIFDVADFYKFGSFIIIGTVDTSFSHNKFKFVKEKDTTLSDIVYVHDGKLKSIDIRQFAPIDINVHQHLKIENNKNSISIDDSFVVIKPAYMENVRAVYKIVL